MTTCEQDQHWMHRALELARSGQGHVEPNPLVGCVLVKDQQLVASGGDVAAVRALARQGEMLTLQKDAMRLVADGTTSLEELQRVFKNA